MLEKARYIVVEGPIGAGKTTLAKRLAERINADVNAMLQDPAIRSALGNQAMTPVGGSVADFRRAVKDDMDRWGPIITRIGVKL